MNASGHDTDPPADVGAAEPAAATGSSGGARSPTDIGITVGFAVMFAWAFVESLSFASRGAGLFPRVITAVGVLLCVIRLVTVFRSGATPRTETLSPGPGGEAHEDDAASNADVEYIFAYASNRAWLASLAWVAGFLLVLAFAGIYVAAALFAVSYLVAVAKMRWWGALIYGAATFAMLYWTFGVLLKIRLPDGILF